MSDAILPNLAQVEKHLKSLGWQCSYNKLKRASERRELVERRGGGWTRRTVETYARGYLTRAIDDAPAMDVPPSAGQPEEESTAAERKIERQAELLDVQTTRARIELSERMGRLTATATVEAELGARATAFRLGLERYGREKAGNVAEIFGGSRDPAAELSRRLGFADDDAERAVAVIMDFCLDRSREFTRFFLGGVDALLDAYATGKWWTEDMGAAWERYRTNRDQDIPEVDL